MRTAMLMLAMMGCAPNLGTPREADGAVRCFDGDALTDGVAVCEMYIAVTSGGCSLPRANDLGCVGGTFCSAHDCFDAPVCAGHVTLDRCAELVSVCADIGGNCVASFDLETGEIGAVVATE